MIKITKEIKTTPIFLVLDCSCSLLIGNGSPNFMQYDVATCLFGNKKNRIRPLNVIAKLWGKNCKKFMH